MSREVDLLGTAEAAELLGVERSRIGRWRQRGVVLRDGRRVAFPAPLVVLRATPVWRGRDVRALRNELAR
jgi:hypothetical protein